MQVVGPWSSSTSRVNFGTYEVRTIDYSVNPTRVDTRTYLGQYPVTDIRTGHRSPPGPDRLLHRPFTFQRNEATMCSVTGTRQWFTNGKLRLREEVTGSFGQPCYFGTATLIGKQFDIPSRHRQLAILNMYSNMRDEKVQLATTLAELVKTVEGVLAPLNQVLNAYQSAKRRDWRGVLRHLGVEGYRWRASSKAVAARWLEVRFGWMPLLGDIKSYTDLANTLATRPLRFTCEGKSFQKPNSFSVSSSVGSQTVNREGVAGYRCSAVMQCSSNFIEVTKDLSLDAPQLTAWELVPYSWLIDYLIPVGSWLGALSAPVGLLFVTGSETQFKKFRVSEEYRGNYKSPSFSYFEQGSASYEVLSVRRNVWTRLPLAYPPVVNPFSTVIRALNTSAVLTQKLKR